MFDSHQFLGTKDKVIPDNGLIIVTVQESDILEGGFRHHLGDYYGLKDEEIATFYGLKQTPITAKTKLILATRTSLFGKMEHAIPLLENKRAYIIVDEAHDAALQKPEEDGQYEQILSILDKVGRSSDHHICFISATPSHMSSQMVTDPLLADGNVVAPMLEPKEIAEFAKGINVEHYTTVGTLRGMALGYTSPGKAIRENVVIHKDGSQGPTHIEIEEDGTRTENLPLAVIHKIAKDLFETRVPGQHHRVLIFTRGTAKIDAMVPELEKALKAEHRKAGIVGRPPVVKAYHSKSEFQEGRSWLSEIDPLKNGPEVEEMRVLVVDRKFRQGADAKPTDRLVFLRKISLDDPHSVREASQNFFRAGRLSPGKTGFIALDYDGNLKGILNLPDRIQTQSQIPYESNEEDDDVQSVGREVNLSNDTTRFLTSREPIIQAQTNSLSESQRFVLEYGDKTLEEIIIKASPFQYRTLAESLTTLIQRFQNIEPSKVSKYRHNPWFGQLESSGPALSYAYEDMLDKASLLLEWISIINQIENEVELREILKTVQSIEKEMSNIWISIFHTALNLDPYRHSSVQYRFVAPDGAYSRSTPINRSIFNSFYHNVFKSGISSSFYSGHQTPRISVDEDGITLSGASAFAYLFAEGGVRHYLKYSKNCLGIGQESKGSDEKTQSYQLETVVLADGEPSFPFNSIGMRPLTIDGSNAMNLDIRNKRYRGPAGIFGDLVVNTRQATVSPSRSDGFEDIFRRRFIGNAELYLNQILVNTILPALPRS